MAAYMKTTQPFYGVQNPQREPVFKAMCEQFAPKDASAYRSAVLTLWSAGLHGGAGEQGDHADGWPACGDPETCKHEPRRDSEMTPPHHPGPREIMYAACYYAEEFPEHATTAHLPLYKRLIVESGWWDVVDWVGAKLVGHAVRTQRSSAAPVMRKWIEDENLWIRRSAIICQLGHKDETDERMLFEFCLDRAGETDFFIRKAIGWALREHAKTNPDAVGSFLKKHAKKLSTLSVREAGKHIGVTA
jgi:3-methyladenine DNA glycosylase AlkD